MLKLNGLPRMNVLQPPLHREMGSLFLMHTAVLKARDMFSMGDAFVLGNSGELYAHLFAQNNAS